MISSLSAKMWTRSGQRLVKKVTQIQNIRNSIRTSSTNSYYHSTSSSSTTSNSSSSSRLKQLAMLLSAGAASAMIVSTMTDEVSAAAEAVPEKKSRHSITDISKLDFRTLGIKECPPLPEHAPTWLRDQTTDPAFQYRDLSAVIDLSDHLLYDGLAGDRKLSEVYFFCEKIIPVDNEHPRNGGAHSEPQVPPTLDFEPQTPGANKPKSTSWASYFASFLPSFLRSKPTAATSKPATESSSKTPATAPTPSPKPVVESTNHLHPTGPEVRAIFHVGRSLCGHRGIVHGGMTAALMDDVSGAATFLAVGGGVFTANLNINYLKPVRAHQYVLIRAQAVKQEGRKTYVNISVEDGTGTVYARGTALYVKPKALPPSVMVAATQ